MERKPNRMEHRLYFQKTEAKEINLDFKPGFFDALQLLKPYPSAHFCQILFDKNTSHRLYSRINQTDLKWLQYEYDPGEQSIFIHEASGINGYRLLSSLLIKTSRNKVSFAIQMPDSRVKNKEKNPLPSLADYNKRQKRTL
jgi:hypothetical protein